MKENWKNLNGTTSVPKRNLFSVLVKQKLILGSPGCLRPPCSLDELKNNEIQGFDRTARTVKKVRLTLNKCPEEGYWKHTETVDE